MNECPVDTRLAVIQDPTSDEAAIMRAITAGPMPQAVAEALALRLAHLSSDVARAALNYSTADVAPTTVRVFALRVGAKKLAYALEAMHFLALVRHYLIAAQDDQPPHELRTAVEAVDEAEAALDALVYDRHRGPPAPMRTW